MRQVGGNCGTVTAVPFTGTPAATAAIGGVTAVRVTWAVGLERNRLTLFLLYCITTRSFLVLRVLSDSSQTPLRVLLESSLRLLSACLGLIAAAVFPSSPSSPSIACLSLSLSLSKAFPVLEILTGLPSACPPVMCTAPSPITAHPAPLCIVGDVHHRGLLAGSDLSCLVVVGSR